MLRRASILFCRRSMSVWKTSRRARSARRRVVSPRHDGKWLRWMLYIQAPCWRMPRPFGDGSGCRAVTRGMRAQLERRLQWLRVVPMVLRCQHQRCHSVSILIRFQLTASIHAEEDEGPEAKTILVHTFQHRVPSW